jgi:YspA, cpYpsA-related SLOG family
VSSRVLVTGGRSYDDIFTVCETLSKIAIGVLIHGGAPGADSLAECYAEDQGIPQRRFDIPPEEWRRLGKKAGPLRNQRMLDEGKPDMVVAFPGGRGTVDMVRRAKKAGIPVMEIK